MIDEDISAQRRVLLVDDDQMSLLYLKTLLEVNGIAVETVHSVVDAKERLAQGNIAFISTDLRMPKDDGLVLIRWCAEHHPEIPMIIYSAYAKGRQDYGALNPSVKAHFSKPIKPDDLNQLIRWMREALVSD